MFTMWNQNCKCFSMALVVFLSVSSFVHSSMTDDMPLDFSKLSAATNCSIPEPYLKIHVRPTKLKNDAFVKVTVTGITNATDDLWVAMVSKVDPADLAFCSDSYGNYFFTGEFTGYPYLCQYPIKAQLLSRMDKKYVECIKKQKEEQNSLGGRKCKKNLCKANLKFHVVNMRKEFHFAAFSGGFSNPCFLAKTPKITFSNPNYPLYGHINSIDSTGETMRVTWVSGSKEAQQVEYGHGRRNVSRVRTFTKDDFCGSPDNPSTAQVYGWHDPGYIHSALMTGLNPSTKYSYRYGSNAVGWSQQVEFRTPPKAGADRLKFIAYGDMGKSPLDGSYIHFDNPGSRSVIDAVAKEIHYGKVDSIFHIGDISYATGFLAEWDFFLHQINPIASKVSYMTAIGNHERDYGSSGSVYEYGDSGGECGVPYETYFQMPNAGKDKPWYSIEQATVHFTVISTEHNWSVNTEQYNWMDQDMAAVDRTKTPWLIFMGHRPMYSSSPDGILPNCDPNFVKTIEPLLLKHKVDLVLVGHVHNYERTCGIYNGTCIALPTLKDGMDTFESRNYKAPVHAVIGMAGFVLDPFNDTATPEWSLKRIHEWGYSRLEATRKELKLEFVSSKTRKVEDRFRLVR